MTIKNVFLVSSLAALLAGCGGSGSDAPPKVIEEVNNAPVITGDLAITAKAEESFTATYTADDEDGDAVTLSVVTSPAYVSHSISGNTLTLAVTPTLFEVGDETQVTLSVTDGTDSTQFSIDVAVTDNPEKYEYKELAPKDVIGSWQLGASAPYAALDFTADKRGVIHNLDGTQTTFTYRFDSEDVQITPIDSQCVMFVDSTESCTRDSIWFNVLKHQSDEAQTRIRFGRLADSEDVFTAQFNAEYEANQGHNLTQGALLQLSGNRVVEGSLDDTALTIDGYALAAMVDREYKERIRRNAGDIINDRITAYYNFEDTYPKWQGEFAGMENGQRVYVPANSDVVTTGDMTFFRSTQYDFSGLLYFTVYVDRILVTRSSDGGVYIQPEYRYEFENASAQIEPFLNQWTTEINKRAYSMHLLPTTPIGDLEVSLDVEYFIDQSIHLPGQQEEVTFELSRLEFKDGGVVLAKYMDYSTNSLTSINGTWESNNGRITLTFEDDVYELSKAPTNDGIPRVFVTSSGEQSFTSAFYQAAEASTLMTAADWNGLFVPHLGRWGEETFYGSYILSSELGMTYYGTDFLYGLYLENNNEYLYERRVHPDGSISYERTRSYQSVTINGVHYDNYESRETITLSVIGVHDGKYVINRDRVIHESAEGGFERTNQYSWLRTYNRVRHFN